jgi:hypothetical protein
MKKSTNLADAGETKNVACSQIEMSDAHALHILSLKGAVAGKEFAALRAEVEGLREARPQSGDDHDQL